MIGWLLGVLLSWQELKSYQDSYRLVTVHSYVDIIILPRLDTRYPTQSGYPDIEPTSPCHILIMLSASLRSSAAWKQLANLFI